MPEGTFAFGGARITTDVNTNFLSEYGGPYYPKQIVACIFAFIHAMLWCQNKNKFYFNFLFLVECFLTKICVIKIYSSKYAKSR